MSIRKALVVAFAGIFLTTGCANLGNTGGWCSDNKFLCAAGVIGLGVLAYVLIDDGDSNDSPGSSSTSTSDERLKRDVVELGTLSNGLTIYSFHYWNDDRTFVSVMAQDLLEDPRFSHAVGIDESGYYTVNLAEIGLRVAGSISDFEEASKNALAGL